MTDEWKVAADIVGERLITTEKRLEKCEADYQALWDKLRKTEVVAEYAQHYANCDLLDSGIGHPMPCTCGLDAARAAMEGE